MFGRGGVPSSTDVSTIHCTTTRERNIEIERNKRGRENKKESIFDGI